MILRDLPIPDTFFFANNVSVSSAIDVDVTWRSNQAPVTRGFGRSVAADDFGAFTGEFRDSTCTGRGGGRQTGFNFITNDLTADGSFATMGTERNGVFM